MASRPLPRGCASIVSSALGCTRFPGPGPCALPTPPGNPRLHRNDPEAAGQRAAGSQAACSRIEAAPRPAPSSTPPESSLTTVKTLDADLNILTFRADLWISEHVDPNASSTAAATATPLVELIIVDEAERLRPQDLEHLRARFDRSRAGLIRGGMPRHREMPGPLPPALQPHRLRASLPATRQGRADLRY